MRNAEKSKILIHQPQGKEDISQFMKFYEIDYVHCQIGSHIKRSLRRKIERGKYVNLAKLLKKPRFDDDDDNCQLVNHDGRAIFIPANEHQRRTILNVEKWEEAFRIYTAIYSKANQERAIEILQHIENIKGAAAKNTWASVYEYDKIFRDVMGTFPGRNWGIITMNVWLKTMEAKTLYNTPSQSNHNTSGFGNINELRCKSGKTELCYKFNWGKCPHTNCKFEHKCSKCF